MTSDSLDVVPWTPPPETIRCVPTKDVNLRLFVPLCLVLLGGCSRGASPVGAKADDEAPDATPPVAMVASSAPAAASSPEESSEVPPRHPPHDVPVCGRTERVFFECHVRDHGTARVARVCGSKDGPVAARYLAFLYGTPRRRSCRRRRADRTCSPSRRRRAAHLATRTRSADPSSFPTRRRSATGSLPASRGGAARAAHRSPASRPRDRCTRWTRARSSSSARRARGGHRSVRMVDDYLVWGRPLNILRIAREV